MSDLHYLIGEGFGQCICGNCSCEDGFTGENCGKKDCIIATKDCLSPDGVSRELLEWLANHNAFRLQYVSFHMTLEAIWY